MTPRNQYRIEMPARQRPNSSVWRYWLRRRITAAQVVDLNALGKKHDIMNRLTRRERVRWSKHSQ